MHLTESIFKVKLFCWDCRVGHKVMVEGPGQARGAKWVSYSDAKTSRMVDALYTQSFVPPWYTLRDATGAHIVGCFSSGGALY